MDLFSLLKQDHLELRAILNRLINKPDPKREGIRDLQGALTDLFLNHAKMEENYLYNRLQQVEAARELVGHSYEDHQMASKTLLTLQAQRPESNEWMQSCRKLLQELEVHIQEEENKLFPLVQSSLDASEVKEIYQKMMQYRKENLQISPDMPIVPD